MKRIRARIKGTDDIIFVTPLPVNKYSTKTKIYSEDELDFEDLQIQTNSAINKVRRFIKEYAENYDAGNNLDAMYGIFDFCKDLDNALRKLKI